MALDNSTEVNLTEVTCLLLAIAAREIRVNMPNNESETAQVRIMRNKQITSRSMTKAQIRAWLDNFNFLHPVDCIIAIEGGCGNTVQLYGTTVGGHYSGDGRYYITVGL